MANFEALRAVLSSPTASAQEKNEARNAIVAMGKDSSPIPSFDKKAEVVKQQVGDALLKNKPITPYPAPPDLRTNVQKWDDFSQEQGEPLSDPLPVGSKVVNGVTVIPEVPVVPSGGNEVLKLKDNNNSAYNQMMKNAMSRAGGGSAGHKINLYSSSKTVRDKDVSDEAMAAFKKTGEAQKDAINAAKRADWATNQKEQDILADRTGELKSQKIDAEYKYAMQEDTVDEAGKAYTQALKDVKDFKVDPNQYWADAGVAGSIALAIASGASAFAMGYSQGKVPDVVGKMIASGIRASIVAQKMELSKKMNVANMSRADKKDAMSRLDKFQSDSERLAAAVTKTQLMETAARYKGTTLEKAALMSISKIDNFLTGQKNLNRERVTKTSSSRQQFVGAKAATAGGINKGEKKSMLEKFSALDQIERLDKSFNKHHPTWLGLNLGGQDSKKFEADRIATAQMINRAINGARASDKDMAYVEKILPSAESWLVGGQSGDTGPYLLDQVRNRVYAQTALEVRVNPNLITTIPARYVPGVMAHLKMLSAKKQGR